MSTATLVVGESAEHAPNADFGPDRLDRWLALQFPQHSRSAIQRWIKDGAVIVNNKPARASTRLLPGDNVQVELRDEVEPVGLVAEDIPLEILYEDADLLVVNKPSGLVVHPAPGHNSGTLVNAILHHVDDLGGIGGELRPGIVHRLDKDTSGVMVIAKNESALRALQSQFKNRKVVKHYLALIEGTLTDVRGRIVASIGRDPRERKRMAVLLESSAGSSGARPATTDYEVRARYSVPLQNDLGRGAFTLVQAHPITGRTHQIRVHFASIGHPLVGDPIYGLKRQRLTAPRLFLHASRLAFTLPSSGIWAEFVAPLPEDLQGVLDRLEAAASK